MWLRGRPGAGFLASRGRAAPDRPGAISSHLMRAVVGGLMEYSSLVLGFRALYVLAALLYVLAFLGSRGRRGGEAGPEAGQNGGS